MHVPLANPLTVAGHHVDAIELRPPGRRVVEAMATERLPGGFSRKATIRFAARLSVHSESTIARLSDHDLDTVRSALQLLYRGGRRRHDAQTAIQRNDRDQRVSREISEVVHGE